MRRQLEGHHKPGPVEVGHAVVARPHGVNLGHHVAVALSPLKVIESIWVTMLRLSMEG